MDKIFLNDIMKTISPSGKEKELQKFLYRHYKQYFDSFKIDEQGTLAGFYRESEPFKIMLAAHADEISLIVTGYNNDGTLQVEKNGGVRTKLYIGAKVRILTPDRTLNGVVATTSALNKKSDVEADELSVDIGCSNREEAEKLVPKGSYIVHDSDMTELANSKFAARAFDDKIGVYIIFEAAKKAIERGARSQIIAVSTTGEETTGRGAYSAASKYHPNVCVCVDVTYATDYKGADEAGDVEIGKGGVICRGSIPNAKLNELLALCAKELSLSVQYEVFAGRTGTDSDTMLKTCDGVSQVLFSVPLRYMHSPVEVLSEKDVDSMIEILALFLEKLDENYSLLPYELD